MNITQYKTGILLLFFTHCFTVLDSECINKAKNLQDVISVFVVTANLTDLNLSPNYSLCHDLVIYICIRIIFDL